MDPIMCRLNPSISSYECLAQVLRKNILSVLIPLSSQEVHNLLPLNVNTLIFVGENHKLRSFFEVRHPRCVEPKLQNGKKHSVLTVIFAIL